MMLQLIHIKTCILYRAVLNYIISRDHKIFSRNPVADIKMLHTSTKKHAAYSNEQMTALKNEMIKQGD